MIRRFTHALLGVDGPQRGTTPRWLPGAVFVATTALALFRIPPASWNILWAEDGAVFVTGAYSGNPWVFLQTYVGYLHIVPRTIAGIVVATTPVQWVPLVIAVGAAVVVGAVATAVFLFARTRVSSTILCLLLSAQVAILPIAGGEVALSIANLHWYLIFGAFWAALVTPPSRRLAVLQCVVVALAILSDPLAALLISPLVLARLVGVRPFTGRAQAVSWAFIGASLVQGIASALAVLLRDERNGSSTLPSAVEFAQTYAGRVILGSLVGPTGTTTIYAAIGDWVLVIGTLIAAAAIALVAVRNPQRRWLVLVLAAASVGFAFVVFVLKWDGLAGIAYGAIAPGGRYLVVPILLLFSAFVVAADGLTGTRLAWLGVAAITAIVVIPGAIDYRAADVRAEAMPWQQSIDASADACTGTPDPAFGNLSIAPVWFGGTLIPCDVLVAARSN